MLLARLTHRAVLVAAATALLLAACIGARDSAAECCAEPGQVDCTAVSDRGLPARARTIQMEGSRYAFDVPAGVGTGAEIGRLVVIDPSWTKVVVHYPSGRFVEDWYTGSTLSDVPLDRVSILPDVAVQFARTPARRRRSSSQGHAGRWPGARRARLSDVVVGPARRGPALRVP